jgi:hypothetical protein
MRSSFAPAGHGQPVMTSDHERPADRYDVSRMDDFEVVADRQRVMAALAALTDRYRALNQEINRRESLRWMLAPPTRP